jgi:starvation-inducible DNA-binding protein
MSAGTKSKSNHKSTTATLHITKHDLSEATREKCCELLNARLADAIDLKLQAKQAHWNVKGPSFIALHELFDQVAAGLEGHVDEIAERITALGGVAIGTSSRVAAATQLSDYPINIRTGRDHVTALSTSMAVFGKLIRQAIDQADEWGDMNTSDLFTEISRGLDKHLWFVEAHVQADE